MKKNLKTIIGAVLGTIIVLGFLFYWYSYRPARIVSICHLEAQKIAADENIKQASLGHKYFVDQTDNLFYGCMVKYGLAEPLLN